MNTVAIVPAMDEEAAISDVVRSLRAAPIDAVVVVDGGSRDATVERAVAAGALVIQDYRRGYGRACLTGAEMSRGADILLFIDGDGADVATQASRLIQPIQDGELDLVIGSRLRGHREAGSLSTLQIIGNRVVAAILNARYGLALTDIGPFRAVRADVLTALPLTELSYGWPTQMIREAAAAGYRVGEVPVDYRRRIGGVSKVSGNTKASLLAGARMLRVALG